MFKNSRRRERSPLPTSQPTQLQFQSFLHHFQLQKLNEKTSNHNLRQESKLIRNSCIEKAIILPTEKQLSELRTTADSAVISTFKALFLV